MESVEESVEDTSEAAGTGAAVAALNDPSKSDPMENIAALMANQAGARRRFKHESGEEARGTSPELDPGPLWRGHNRSSKSYPRPSLPPLMLTGSLPPRLSPQHSAPDQNRFSGPPVQHAYPYIAPVVLEDVTNWLSEEVDNECLFDGDSGLFDSHAWISMPEKKLEKRKSVQDLISDLGCNLSVTVWNFIDNQVLNIADHASTPSIATDAQVPDKNLAATRLQAAHRGKAARKHVQRLKMNGCSSSRGFVQSDRSNLDLLALDAGQAEIISGPTVDVSRSPIPWPHGDQPLPIPRFNNNITANVNMSLAGGEGNGSAGAPKQSEVVCDTVQACRSLPSFAGDVPLPEPLIDMQSRRVRKQLEVEQSAAVRIQSVHRGRADRIKVEGMKAQQKVDNCFSSNRTAYVAPSKSDEVCCRGHDLCWHAWQCKGCDKRGHGLRWGCIECPEANMCQSCENPKMSIYY